MGAVLSARRGGDTALGGAGSGSRGGAGGVAVLGVTARGGASGSCLAVREGGGGVRVGFGTSWIATGSRVAGPRVAVVGNGRRRSSQKQRTCSTSDAHRYHGKRDDFMIIWGDCRLLSSSGGVSSSVSRESPTLKWLLCHARRYESVQHRRRATQKSCRHQCVPYEQRS